MAEALVSVVVEQLILIIQQQLEEEVRLVAGVKQQVENLTSNFKSIQAVLDDAERRQVKDESVKDWLRKLKDAAYDIGDVLDEWNTALQIQGLPQVLVPSKKKLAIPSPCFCFNEVTLRRDIAIKIKNLNERLDLIAKEKERYEFHHSTRTQEVERRETAKFVNVSGVRGRDQDKDIMLKKLFSESSGEENNLVIVSIVGTGGIGKTTLAQLCCDDGEVKAHFDKIIWVCCEPFDQKKIAKDIVEAVEDATPSLDSLDVLLNHIQKSTERKKILLILDDVWTEDVEKWEPLRNSLMSCAKGSKVLVTTRRDEVANKMGASFKHYLRELSEADSWSLFSQIAFTGKERSVCEKFEKIGQEIVKRCKGWPLAVKTLGSLLQFKNHMEDWQSILDSEVWESKMVERCICPPLLLSYYDLPFAVKQCFLYCAVFPKDTMLWEDDLVKLWMAQGYLGLGDNMEKRGRDYFENLASHSLFQDFEKDGDGRIIRCKMHDLVHDFVQFLAKDECFIMEVDDIKELRLKSSCGRARHLTLIHGPDFWSINNGENLRSLLVTAKSKIDQLLASGFFDQLKCIRSLSLIDCCLKVLPEVVGKLIHLRYLNLSRNHLLVKLPDAMCDLYNLQTLKINDCSGIRELPQRMGKLFNLRHFELQCLTELEVLPKGIGTLSSLRTLTDFIVSRGDRQDGCKIEDLRNLNELRGSLEIRGLENMSNWDDAERAELKSKMHLRRLKLCFNGEDGIDNMPWYYARFGEEQERERRRLKEEEEEGKGFLKDELLLGALQAPPNLEELEIRNYRGTALSAFNYLMFLLPNLRKLKLYKVRTWECLPALGRLSSLETLEFVIVDNVKRVGDEFLGIDNIVDGSGSGSGSGDNRKVVSFRKLKHLRLEAMPDLEEWEALTSNNNAIIMPCLATLEINFCKKLKALPRFLRTTPLERLSILDLYVSKDAAKSTPGRTGTSYLTSQWLNVGTINFA